MNRRIISNPDIGDKVEILALGRETDGSFSKFRMAILPGGATPGHYHLNFSETFNMIEGEIEFSLGKEKHLLKATETLTVPPLCPHHFKTVGDQTAVVDIILHPEVGFAETLQIIYGLSEAGKTNRKGIPKNILDKAYLAIKGKTRPVGIPRLILEPGLWFFYGLSKIFAREKHLAKYIKHR